MNLTKAVAENLGKMFLNIGQGMILASFVTALLGKEIQTFSVLVLAFVVGLYTAGVGLWLIAGSEHKE